jgi:hypothetical protein
MLGRKRHDRQSGERSAGGSRILRHQPRQRGWEAARQGDPAIREAIDGHLADHLGEDMLVWHEIASDLVHIDVYMWSPTEARPMYTFVTVGMSDRPMTVPRDLHGGGVSDRAELIICLPPTWPVPAAGSGATAPWDDPDAYFPIRWLKTLARLPHEYRTWLGFGHTVPNGDPALPLAGTTQLCGWVLLRPRTLPSSFGSVELRGGGRIDVFGIVGLHQAEMDHKLAYGADSLLGGLLLARVSELLDINRPSTKP